MHNSTAAKWHTQKNLWLHLASWIFPDSQPLLGSKTELSLGKVKNYTAHTGCFKKNFTLGISAISMAIKNLEGLDIFQLKGGIHSSVSSTNFFFISGSLDISKSKLGIWFKKFYILDNLTVLKSDGLHWFASISAALCWTEIGLNLKHA